MKYVPRFDHPRPKTSKVAGQTQNSLQTDGRTDVQRHTIIRSVKDGRITVIYTGI